MLKEEKIQQIPLDDLIPNPGNRKIGGFDPDKLQQLAESILAVGLQQPIVIRPNEQAKFDIVTGERRWRASRLAGLLDIPAVIRDLDDVTVLKIQTIENLQREDIHPLDEADGYSRLIEKAGYDVELLAQEVGRSVSYIYQRLKLLDLVPPALKMLAAGEIHAGHAILIARLPPGQQKQLLKEAHIFRREEMPSVRELNSYIQRTILLELNKVAFKKDDPDLDPQAGPCTTCPKRTGYQPALFADVCNGDKRDYCTDPPCFNGKLAALIQRRRIELEESGMKYLEVAAGYIHSYQEEQRLQKAKVKLRGEWEECKKKDEGAVRCVVVAGDSQGRLTWGRERKQTRYGSYEKTPEEKAVEAKERRKRKIQAAVRRRIWDEVTQTLGNRGVYKELPVDLLRMIASVFWKRTWDNTQALYCKTLGWEQPPKKPGEYSHPWESMGNSRIAEMSPEELFRFLLTVALVSELEGPGYNEPDCKKLKEVAALYGVDVKTLEDDVKLQFKEKETHAKKRAAKKKVKTKQVEASKK